MHIKTDFVQLLACGIAQQRWERRLVRSESRSKNSGFELE